MKEMGYWLEDLLGEISSNENQEVCQGLLKKCGGRCAERNALPGMGGLKEELAGIEDMEEIACIISRHTGAECVPEEDGFLLTYNRGKGCDCSIVRAGYVHSPVFCNCTLGFHQKVWSTIFERPVRVELVETFLRGGNCCSQKVFIPAGNEPN